MTKQGISLPYKVKTIEVGEKFKFEPVVTPETSIDKSYAVISDNPTVAGYVTGNYIKGFKHGTAVVQAKLKTGNLVFCLVNVLGPDVPINPFEVGTKLKMGTGISRELVEFDLEWYVVAYDMVHHMAILQSTGFQAGLWPGYVASGYSYTEEDWNDKDIHSVYGINSNLYNFYETQEWKKVCADATKGLYLIDRETAGGGYYNVGLRVASENYRFFGATYNESWTGTHDGTSFAYCVDSDGENTYVDRQDSNFVIAPCFVLDTDKVEVVDGVVLKKIIPSPLIVGNRYKMGKILDWNSYEKDVEWYVVSYDETNGTAILQSTGLQAGQWPGYIVRSAATSENWSNTDISRIYGTESNLYQYFLVDGWSNICTDLVKGLYLVDKTTAESGFYNTGLTDAAINAKLFDLNAGEATWTGTPDVSYSPSIYTYCVRSDGNLYSYVEDAFDGSQDRKYIIAPAMQINTTKIEVTGDTITMKL